MLVFTDPSGTPAPISSAVLGTHVRDHDPLRLVVLNACQTARADDADPYSGMAQGLIQQEAAAVVAMQFPISDDAAIVFTHEFYGAVADGEPLDQAMASTRKALLADHGSEWATPVLFLRAPDGRIFDRIGDPGRPAQPRQQAPAGEAGGAGPPLGTAAIRSAAGPPGPPPASSPAARRPSPGRPRAPVPPARRPRRRRKYWLAGAATLLAAAVLTGIALISGGRAPTPDAASQSLASPARPARPGRPPRRAGAAAQRRPPLTYRTYTNQRFGFTALRPASFTVKSRLPDGQGVTWVSPDGMVVSFCVRERKCPRILASSGRTG